MIVSILLILITLAGLINNSAGSQAGSSTRAGDDFNDLQPQLSSAAEIYHPGSAGYINLTPRWSADITPGLDVIVKVASEKDVQATVSSPPPLMLSESWYRVSTPERQIFHY